MDFRTVTAVFSLLALGHAALVEDESRVAPTIPGGPVKHHLGHSSSSRSTTTHSKHEEHVTTVTHITGHVHGHDHGQGRDHVHGHDHIHDHGHGHGHGNKKTKRQARKDRKARKRDKKQTKKSSSSKHVTVSHVSHVKTVHHHSHYAINPKPSPKSAPEPAPTPALGPAVAKTSPPIPIPGGPANHHPHPTTETSPPTSPVPTLSTICVHQPDESCAHKGIQFVGAGIVQVMGLSGNKVGVTHCAKVCNLTPNCKAITLHEASGKCTLLATYGGDKPVQREGWTSLNMDCKRESVLDTSCALKDTDFGGQLQSYHNIASLAECAKLCLVSELCKAVSYTTGGKKCVTKDSIGGSELEHKAGVTSLNMDCTRHRYLDEGCSHVGMNIPGVPIAHNPVRPISLRMCADQCVSEPGCKSIVHQRVGKADTCTLLSGFDLSLEKGTYNPGSRGVTSLNIHCKREETLFDIWCCKHPNTLFKGPNRAHLTGVKEEECVRMCLADNGCKAASYNTKTTDCFFKNKTNGDGLDTGADAKGIISFNMEGDCAKNNTA